MAHPESNDAGHSAIITAADRPGIVRLSYGSGNTCHAHVNRLITCDLSPVMNTDLSLLLLSARAHRGASAQPHRTQNILQGNAQAFGFLLAHSGNYES